MPDTQRILAEFEALGEIEVNSRVDNKVYDDTTRAYAVRWLNQKAMTRAQVVRVTDLGQERSQYDLTRRAQGSAYVAMAVATVATAAAILSAGAAYQATRMAKGAVERAQILANVVPYATPAPVARRHRAK